jgi:hypothetical protein
MPNTHYPGKRWYDKDPALSMAISLLNNATSEQQRLTAEHILSLIEHLIDEETGYQPLQTRQFLQVAHLFPNPRRLHMESTANRMVEILKTLPTEVQLDMALNIINQIYMLEANLALPSPTAVTAKRAKAQSALTS